MNRLKKRLKSTCNRITKLQDKYPPEERIGNIKLKLKELYNQEYLLLEQLKKRRSK